MAVILEAMNIYKSFGENHVHRGLSFDLQKGETLGLLGNSGTGKSVLLRALIGLEKIDSGSIHFHHNQQVIGISEMEEEDLLPVRTKISYAFQSGALFDSINVFENIAYPLREHTTLTEDEIENKVFNVLELVRMKDKSHLMPSDLSGGMQKRVGMARSIILKPEIILYDEPTAGLDPVNVVNILNIMENLKSLNISSIFVTHDIPAATSICDRIIILHEGKVGFSGTPRELKSSHDPIVKKFFTTKEKEERGI